MSQTHAQNLSFLILPHYSICSPSRLWRLKKVHPADCLEPGAIFVASLSPQHILSAQPPEYIQSLVLSSACATLKAAVLLYLDYCCHPLPDAPDFSSCSFCNLVLTQNPEQSRWNPGQIQSISVQSFQCLSIRYKVNPSILTLSISLYGFDSLSFPTSSPATLLCASSTLAWLISWCQACFHLRTFTSAAAAAAAATCKSILPLRCLVPPLSRVFVQLQSSQPVLP